MISANTANGAKNTDANETTETQSNGDEKGPALERLSVSYWPEYDKPSVLVIYRGQLDSSLDIPATLRIAIPKGKDVEVTGVSGLAPDGAHDHARSEPTKKIVNAGDKRILSFDSYYPDFQFELYMESVSGGGKRDFKFDLELINAVKAINVDIRKPVRAQDFKIVPAAAEVRPADGFDNYLYSFSNATPGQEYSFDVTYDRPDSQPSIDSQTGEVDATGGRTRSLIFIISILVLIIAGVAIGFWRMQTVAKSATSRPVKPKSKSKQKARKKKSSSARPEHTEKKFCPSCGEKVEPSSKFCRECGERL